MMTSDAPKPGKRKSVKYPIPANHLAAIGRAADTWNQLEFLVDRTIWKLVHAEQSVVACLTSQYSGIFPRMSALISLISMFDLSAEAEKQFKQLLGKLGSLSSLRNRIIHDPRYMSDDMGVVRFEVTGKNKLRFGSEQETIEELEAFRDEVDKVRLEFLAAWAIVAKVIDEQPKLLSRQRNRIVMNDLD